MLKDKMGIQPELRRVVNKIQFVEGANVSTAETVAALVADYNDLAGKFNALLVALTAKGYMELE